MKFWECLNVPGQHVSVPPQIDSSTPTMVLPPYPDYDGDTIPIEVDPSVPTAAEDSTTENSETPYERSMRIAEEYMENNPDAVLTMSESNAEYLRVIEQTPPPEGILPSEPEIYSTYGTIMSPGVGNLISHMSELAKQTEVSIPESLEKTELNDDQAGEVMGTLMKYYKEYFYNIPLKAVHDKRFVFNIPKSVYDAHIKNENYMRPHCLDPLFWFYLFCTEDPYDNIGAFIDQAMLLIEEKEGWVDGIYDSSKEYLEALDEEEEESDEESEDVLDDVEEDDDLPDIDTDTDVEEDSE